MTELDKIIAKLGKYRSIMGDIEDIEREDFKDQLEHSKGPDGTSYPKLAASTLKQKRRSSRPYDTLEREVWNGYVERSGGKVIIGSDFIVIINDVEGAEPSYIKRPVGVSDEGAEKVAERIADYLVED